jgi:hypothetical protein
VPSGSSLEGLYRDAVRQRLDGRNPTVDQEAVRRAQQALRLGTKDAPFAAMYLHEVGTPPQFRFSAAKALKQALRSETELEDLTASIDPRVTGALLHLKLSHDLSEALGEARRRLAATQLFTALMEAGFMPDNNWMEAVDSADPAQDLAATAAGNARDELENAFRAFAGLPDEARLRRLAYLAEANAHLELLSRLPEGTEPPWLQEPEVRECHEVEMQVIQALRAEDVPIKAAALAKAELGVEPGTVPEDSEGDLFIHLRCPTCGKEKLIVQSP